MKTFPPGEELDDLVLLATRTRRSIADAVCVPYGPEDSPLGWVAVGPTAGPMQPGGEIRRVYVRKCECPKATPVEGFRTDEDSVGGHGLGCLEPVPRFSLEDSAALPLMRRFKKMDLQKDVVNGKERWTLTEYEAGLYVEGETFAHVLSLAVVEHARSKCSTSSR